MFGLTALRNAIARLTGSLNALADTADAINHGVRSHLALDAPAVIDAPALTDSTMPAVASGLPQDATTSDATPTTASTPRNGRRRPTRAGAAAG